MTRLHSIITRTQRANRGLFFLKHERMFKLDMICGSENSPNVWDLYLQKHDGLSFVCVWENKNNHKISNKSAKRFWAQGCEDMIMEIKKEGSGAYCGAF
jgi:hypothetical protein